VSQMLGLLKSFWTAVAQTFPDAWGLRSRRSRLTHGVGIVSLGHVMDAIVDSCDGFSITTIDPNVRCRLVGPGSFGDPSR
jgi:hypothetical protein